MTQRCATRSSERLIMDQIVLQMAKMGVKVSTSSSIRRSRTLRNRTTCPLDQMRSRLAYDGISYATYRNQIRKEMLISASA